MYLAKMQKEIHGSNSEWLLKSSILAFLKKIELNTKSILIMVAILPK